jgi:uncharacterized membrane protein
MISTQVLSTQTLVIGWLIYVPVVLWAIWRTPWVELFSDTRRQHLLFGTVFGLFLLWLVRRDFEGGVSYHFIGLTVVTLLLDWPLAVVGALLAQVGLVLLGRQELAAMGVNGVLLILLPIAVTEGCARMVERAQPRQSLCVYLLFGFFLRSVGGVAVYRGGAWGVVAGRVVRDAVLAGGLCRLSVADHLSRGIYQRDAGYRTGGVLPRVA